MALESELGVKLFERSNKQVDLTEAGIALFNDSGSFIDHMETIIKNVQLADKGNSGILRITLPSQLYYILSGPLAVMRDKHPEVKLIFESYLFDEIPSSIQYDLYNVGLTYDFAYPIQEGIESIPIESEGFSLVASSKHMKGSPQETIAYVVRTLPLLQPAHVEPPFLKRLLSVFQDHADTKIINTIHVNTSESVILNASLGLGYGIIPTSWARSHYNSEDVSYIDLSELPAKCSIVMLYKKNSATELTKSFVSIIKEHATLQKADRCD
jgi:DNA-binding transcriptional LysR family regulator